MYTIQNSQIHIVHSNVPAYVGCVCYLLLINSNQNNNNKYMHMYTI